RARGARGARRVVTSEGVRARLERAIVARLREVENGRPRRDQLPAALREAMSSERVVVPSGELRELERWFEDRLFGLAALAPLLRDERVSEVMVSGTSSGKTTTLNALGYAIGERERVVTIEDAAELRLPQPNVVALETRAPSVEGTGAVDVRALLRAALRMRPDRIVVGEVRGGEALDMLQAMNTGHRGSLTTAHANGAYHA